MTRNDDSNEARKAAIADLRELMKSYREMAPQALFCDGDFSGWPDSDGAGMFIQIVIGLRGDLSKAEARRCAAMWRKATNRYPKAGFIISLAGYDEDPREIWEFGDARRYVRWWARFAGMDDLNTADRWLGLTSAIGASGNCAGMVLFAACGVFGEAACQMSLRGHARTAPQ
jgi:hypothetical protein